VGDLEVFVMGGVLLLEAFDAGIVEGGAEVGEVAVALFGELDVDDALVGAHEWLFEAAVDGPAVEGVVEQSAADGLFERFAVGGSDERLIFTHLVKR
jgi:hypothetical protein